MTARIQKHTVLWDEQVYCGPNINRCHTLLVPTSCWRHLGPALKAKQQAAASQLGALVIKKLMTQMLSAAAFEFLHAAVDSRHLEQPKPIISMVKQSQQHQHHIAPSPAAAADSPTSRHQQRPDCVPLDSAKLRETISMTISIAAQAKMPGTAFEKITRASTH